MGNCSTSAGTAAPLVIRLVGWTSRIVEPEITAKKVATHVTDYVQKKNSGRPVYILWDGDLLAPDSFTAAIPLLYDTLPKATFVPVMLNSWIPKLSTGDQETLPGSIGYTFATESMQQRTPTEPLAPPTAPQRAFAVGVDNDIVSDGDWSQLGLKALEWAHVIAGSECTTVFCIGGGQTVSKEKEVVTQRGSEKLYGKVEYINIPGIERAEAH